MLDRAKAGLALLALLGVLAAFWGALYWGETAVRPAGMTPPPALAYVRADDAGNPAAGAQPQEATFEPNPIYRARVDERSGPRVVFQIPFTPPAGQEDLAFFIGAPPAFRRSSSTAR